MASIHLDPKSGVWRIMFRYGGKQFRKSLKTTDPNEAETERGRIEATLQAIERGWKTVPPNADLWEFVYSGGKREAKPTLADVLTLEKMFARYEELMPAGTMEENSLGTYRLHKRHLLRVLGGRTNAQNSHRDRHAAVRQRTGQGKV